MRTNEFYHNNAPLKGKVGDAEFTTPIDYYEVLEPSTAQVISRFSNVDGAPAAITVNRFGKGQAIYVATPAHPAILAPLYRSLYAQLGIKPGPKTPDGVYARIVNGRTLYVNSTSAPKDIPLEGDKTGLLSGKAWHGVLHLDAYGVDLVE